MSTWLWDSRCFSTILRLHSFTFFVRFVIFLSDRKRWAFKEYFCIYVG